MKIHSFIISLAIISSLLIGLSTIRKPKIRIFNENDTSLQKEYKKKEYIKIETVTLITIVIPMIIFIGIFRTFHISFKNEIIFYMAFLTSLLMTSGLVENIKNIIGRLRPDFISRCKPIGKICSGDYKIVENGRKSFPSGHTATSACGFSFCFFFLFSHYFKVLFVSFNSCLVGVGLCGVFFAFPALVGISRILDNRHFIGDVIGGFLIGFISSIIVFKMIDKKILGNNAL